MGFLQLSSINGARLMLEGGAIAGEADEQVVSMSEVKALKKRIKELERSLGRKTLEDDILKAAADYNAYAPHKGLGWLSPR